MALLTSARRAVWSALDDWPALAGVFRRTWRCDGEAVLALPIEPGPTELPAITIQPTATTKPDWIRTRTQVIPYVLQVRLWTPGWSLPLGERIWEESIKALHQSAPAPGGPTHLMVGTGSNIVEVGSLSAEPIRIARDQVPATLWRWTIALRILWDPLSAM